jgi:hypothetical protein
MPLRLLQRAPLILLLMYLALACLGAARQKGAERQNPYPLPYPPALPGGQTVVTDESADLLKPPPGLREGVAIAKTPPRIDFLYYPGQDHAGKPWSDWGEGCVADGKFYSAIGDHLSPRGTGLVYEYDPASKKLRVLADVRKFLEEGGHLPPGSDYTPGKIHSKVQMGSDGWLYYATHRGSTKVTSNEHRYEGDWVLRTHPATGKTEVVMRGPVPKHSIPTSVLDPRRLIFYAGTAPGTHAEKQDVQFFALDVKSGKVLLAAGDGPKRSAILSSSTGRLYWDGKKYDPKTNRITDCPAAPGVRSATWETPQAVVYGTTERSADVWAFNVKDETLTQLGSGAVGKQEYTTSMAADPTGRYLYYVPGAHGKAAGDGTPVVQFDVKARKPKVLAFLAPYYAAKYGYTPDGTFGVALDEKGETLFVTWNGMRKGQPKFWESCAMTAIHIPASERPR